MGHEKVAKVVGAAQNLIRQTNTKNGGPWVQAHDLFVCHFCGGDGYRYPKTHHKPSCPWWRLEKAVKDLRI